MWLSSMKVRGLATEVFCEWERVGALSPAGPAADGLALLAGALDPSRAEESVRLLGWGESTRAEREVALENPSAVRRVLAEGPRPQITIEVVIRPDPPLYGRLRDAVLRDPQLAEGLGEGTLTVRVGWLFTPDCAFASLDLLGVALGSVPVPLQDRPPWVDSVLLDVGGRLGFVDWRTPLSTVAEELREGLLAPDISRREGARRALAASADSPLSVPLEIIDGAQVELAVGPELQPLHWRGPRGAGIARLVHGVFISQPDVLVVLEPVSADLQQWLSAQLDGDEATLEQVLVPGD